MKTKIIAPIAALLGGVLFAGSAFADVEVTATITKKKNITVTERIFIDKGISVRVNLLRVNHDAAAEAMAIVNVVNRDNFVGPRVVGATNHNNDPFPSIGRSVTFNTGIVGVNQDVGSNNNQGNVVALAYTDLEHGFTNSQAEGDQVNTNNEVQVRPRFFPGVGFPPTTNTNWTMIVRIVASINDNTGVVGVNQNGGNNNNQHNLVALAVGIDPMLALAEGALGQENAGNKVFARNTIKQDLIQDSVNGNTGIISVNQSGGHMNNQMSAVSVSAAVSAPTSFGNLLGL